MSVLQNKKDVEQLVYDVWTHTDVHWSGHEFDITARSEWVRCQYEPEEITYRGIYSTELKYSGIIKFAMFAETEFRAYELLDLSISIFSNNKIGNMFDSRINIIDTGKTDDGKFYYVDSEIILSTL